MWTKERKDQLSKRISQLWEERHDELVAIRRDTDSRKYSDLKPLKQTEFGTGVRDPEGYRDYQREVQRIYRENNPEIMQYYRDYRNKKNAREREEKIRKLQEAVMTHSAVVGKYVVTIDGRFFRINTGEEYFPDKYIIIDGKRYNTKRLVHDTFFDYGYLDELKDKFDRLVHELMDVITEIEELTNGKEESKLC